MALKYSTSISGGTIPTTGSHCFEAAATIDLQGASFRIYEIHLAGEAAASAYYRVAFNRPSTAGTEGAGTHVHPQKLHPSHPAAGVTPLLAAFTANPGVPAADVLHLSFNGYGGAVRWHAPVDGEVWVVRGVLESQIAVMSRNGSITVSGHILHEEF